MNKLLWIVLGTLAGISENQGPAIYPKYNEVPVPGTDGTHDCQQNPHRCVFLRF